MTALKTRENMLVSLKKEVVQNKWIVVINDRERWPTVKVVPLK